jgi:hypothetical protein
MRGSKAKALRRMVYGEGSRRPEREYEILSYKVLTPIGVAVHHTFINRPGSQRWLYQQMKKHY